VRRRLSAVLAVVLGSVLLATSSTAETGDWTPLQEADGRTLAVALDQQSTALISVGGPDEATIYDQRRGPDGTLGPVTPVTTVAGVEHCVPVEAATALGNVAVAVECQTKTGLEDPPTRLVELVWTGDDGWTSHVQREGVLSSLDYSPQGQYVVFASNSQYGRAHHLTSYHADLGWRDVTRGDRGSYGDDLVAAVDDAGNLVVLRGAGFEDEPGYWDGGRLGIETYDAAARRWTKRFTRAYPGGGIDPSGVDVAAGLISATLVRSRSTGQLNGLADKMVVLSGTPDHPRFWSTPRWSRDVLTGSAAITGTGVGVGAWQAVDGVRTARSWFATWAPGRSTPAVHALTGRTTLTLAADSGRALDLSVTTDGRGAVAHVRHQAHTHSSTVVVTTFGVGSDGVPAGQAVATWEQPVGTTVAVTTGAGATSLTLGRLLAPFYLSTQTRYSVGP
jgi:hypothetical protein